MFARAPGHWLVAISTAALVSPLVACGDSGSADPTAPPTDTATAVRTAGATETEDVPTQTPEPGASTATPADPTLPPLPAQAREVARGTVTLFLPPAGLEEIDPVNLAVEQAGAAPPCAALVANWAWSAIPPVEDLVVSATRQGGGDVVGEGPSGTMNGGCLLMRFANNSDRQTEIIIDYLIGGLSP